MRRPRRWWTVFVAGSLAVLAGLVWLSLRTLRAEQAAIADRARAEEQAALRLAMWRLDAWMGGFLAREAARSFSEYLPGAAASPLHHFESAYIRCHFHLDGDGKLTIPNPPPSGPVTSLEGLASTLGRERLRRKVAAAEQRLVERLSDSPWPPAASEFSRRAAAGAVCQTPEASAAGALRLTADIGRAQVGSLVPIWLEPASVDGDFIFVRRVEWLGFETFQGFVGDWPSLRAGLLSQVADLFPEAELVPVAPARPPPGDGDGEPVRLATLPVDLAIAPRPPAADPGFTPTRRKLALVWLAVAVAMAAVGRTLRASIDFGRRRQRFASAVAHELRTPLTTFQMYTEMLADGTIRDPPARQEYLETLQRESRRLAGLVENVLAYAGLEEQPAYRTLERVTLGGLLERVAPTLRRRCDEAGLELEIVRDTPADGELELDVDLVERLLFNLVDNACKYAGSNRGAPVRLRVALRDRHVVLRVRDQGPGIPRSCARKIFEPFDRGPRQPGDPQPGVGLGLALTRSLARASGGDLTLEAPAGGGACFVLRLQAR